MNKTNFAQTVAFVAGVAIVGASVTQSIKTHRTERARREKIEAELQLDLTAIKRAGAVIQEKIQTDSAFVPLHTRMEQFDNEMAFQKIVIREQ